MRSVKHQGKTTRRRPARAAFQPDAPDIRDAEQYTSFLHQQSPSPAAWEATPRQPLQDTQDPWQAPFVAQPQDWYLQDEMGAVQYQAVPSPVEFPAPKRMSKGWLLTILISLGIIALCGLIIYNAYRPQSSFANKLKRMQQPVFARGIMVDRIDIGGKTMEEALALTRQSHQDQQVLQLIVQIDSTAFRITGQQIPIERNLQAVLDEAWSLGRRGMLWGISSGLTPFEIRWRHSVQLEKDKAYFSTKVSYDPARVRSLAESLAQQVSRDPVNAVLEQFNFSTKEFTVTQDVPGCKIDASQIESAILGALNAQQYNSQIVLSTAPVMPQVTSVDLRNNFTQLASCSTKTTSDTARNNNIGLAAQSISNHTLMPGETFSFNQATGQRTAEKGYQGAPAIAGGVLIDDVGGGVCQVSSTLFNAAALADLTIVERSAHAWPVSYIDKGLDATVNWPNLDLKFRNDRSTPVFIIASYNKRQLTVEVYGMRIAPGESIRLETELISTTKPPAEPLYQQNPSLPFQTTRELKPARTGYEVDTYRVYLRNGVEYRRVKLFSSKYKMVQQVIEYN